MKHLSSSQRLGNLTKIEKILFQKMKTYFDLYSFTRFLLIKYTYFRKFKIIKFRQKKTYSDYYIDKRLTKETSRAH